MILLLEHKLCFLAQPRTGSNAVARALEEQLGARSVGLHHSLPSENRWCLPRDWMVVSTVRNHWDAVVSWFCKRDTDWGCDFDGFLDLLANGGLRGYVQRTPVGELELYWRYLPLTTHLLRYERLQVDLDRVLALRGLGPCPLGRVNVSQSREDADYRTFYDAQQAARVGRLFASEIERLGYTFSR